MTKHPSDLKLWQYSRNLLSENELKEIRMHVLDCPDCMCDLVSLVELNQLEELDGRGELPELDKTEAESMLQVLGLLPQNAPKNATNPVLPTQGNDNVKDKSFGSVAGLGIVGLTTAGASVGSFIASAGKPVPLGPILATGHPENFSENLENNVRKPDVIDTNNVPDPSDNAEDNHNGDRIMTDSLGFASPQNNYGLPAIDGQFSEVNQGYDSTCAVRCQELILREFGIYIPQEDLMNEAASNGWFTENGGTPMEDVGKLLESHGVSMTQYEGANIFNLATEIAQGHKVIVGVDANELWGQTGIIHDILEFFGHETPNHALLVSGVDTSDPDNVRVIITDPGTGDVAKSYPLQEFLDAWKDSNYFMVSTDDPVPMHMNSPEMTYFNYVEGHIPMIGNISYEDFEHHFSPYFGMSCHAPAFSEAIELMAESQELGYVPDASPVNTENNETADVEGFAEDDGEIDQEQSSDADFNDSDGQENNITDGETDFGEHFDFDDAIF